MEELTGPLEEVFKDLKRHWKQFQESEPLLDIIKGFVHAIDWRETWIMGILALHVVMLLSALFLRRNTAVQAAVFMVAGCIVFLSERLNALGAKHWERFAGQNYFDRQGVFMSAVVSGPLLVAMFIVLINYLISCAAMLVEAKKKELRHKARLRAKQAKEAGAGAGAGAGAAGGKAGGGGGGGSSSGAGSKKDK